jgi:hypothetical protein
MTLIYGVVDCHNQGNSLDVRVFYPDTCCTMSAYHGLLSPFSLHMKYPAIPLEALLTQASWSCITIEIVDNFRPLKYSITTITRAHAKSIL